MESSTQWFAEYLTPLLGVEAPDNTEYLSSKLDFRGGVSVWIAILLMFFMAIGIAFFYSREQGTLRWIRRIVLIFLRTALVALLVLLLFRPVLLANFKGERPRNIYVLLDNSASMKQQDRRVTDEDQIRVAIAKNVPIHGKESSLKFKMSDLKSPADVPQGLPKDPSRANMVRWMLTHPDLKLFEKLEKVGPLRPMLFGTHLQGLRDESASTSKKDEKGPQKKPLVDRLLDKNNFTMADMATKLADSIDQVLERKDSDLPAGIVVISDGVDNASKLPIRDIGQKCKRLGVPLYIYGVGTPEGGNLRFKEVQAPDTLFVKDMASIPISWLAQGFKKGKMEISVTLGGQPVELQVGEEKVKKKVIDVQNGLDLRETITFPVEDRQKKDDVVKLVVKIAHVGDDRFKDVFKDTVTTDVRIVDRKIKLLMIENSPRWEFKHLMISLLRDRRIDPKFLLVNADPKVTNSNDPASPYIAEFPKTREKFFDAKYNVILLGDVAPGYLGKEHMEWIREFVEKRGGLIVVAGRQNMPGSYKGTPLEEVLPVDFNTVKFQMEAKERPLEYSPTLTDIGMRSSMLFLDDSPEKNLKIWQSLPGFFWQYPVTKLKPGATALVVNPRAKISDLKGETKQAMPLIATQYYGQGKVLFCGSDETWRWRFNVQDKYFVRYWGQIIYQMGLPHLLGDGGKRAQFSLEHAEAELDRPSYIYVRVLDKDFNPRKDEKIDAEVIQEGKGAKKKVSLLAIAGRPGEYRALMDNDAPGKFELKFTNPGSSIPGSAGVESFAYRVDAPKKHELEETSMAEKELRDLAAQSGGKFYREEDLYQLPADVKQQKSEFRIHQEVILWNPLALLLFVGLITAEWVVRKFSNLS